MTHEDYQRDLTNAATTRGKFTDPNGLRKARAFGQRVTGLFRSIEEIGQSPKAAAEALSQLGKLRRHGTTSAKRKLAEALMDLIEEEAKS